MSGITTGVGLFSGIDTATLIEQLLAIEARPRDLAQQRVLQLQLQQSAYLDINSKLGALRTAVKNFRLNSIFESMGALSSDTSVLGATASKSAVPGTYSFVVDRLVSSQQLLSRGFADADSTAINADSITLESAKGRLDRDVALADLNAGAGVARGKIQITVGTSSGTIDLSKAVTVNDVIDAINASGLGVTASVDDDHLVLTASSGTSAITVANAAGYTTADSLGLTGSATGTLTGDSVYSLVDATTLSQLNDGNGVAIGSDVGENRYDFTIRIDGTTDVEVNIGSIWDIVDGETTETSGPASTVGDVIDRINDAITEQAPTSGVSASIVSGRIVLTHSTGGTVQVLEKGEETGGSALATTARDLGIHATSSGGTLTGERTLAGINSTLIANLNGGSGLGAGSTLSFTSRDITAFSVNAGSADTLQELIDLINNNAANTGQIVASLNDAGNGLLITDTTGGTSNLIVTGDAASVLGIDTGATGVAESSVRGDNLQHRYVSESTRLASLNAGQGIGTGKFRITDANGVAITIDIGSDAKTVQDLLDEINAQASALDANISARINDNGDGILIEEGADPDGASAITIEDVTGSVAKNLGIAGEAAGVGPDNSIDGTAETVIDLDAADTLEEIVDKINAAGGPARASIINDGTGSTPFRINFSSVASGTDGRVIIDDMGLGLGLSTLDAGEDARVFFGSTDPAKAVLLTSSTNTLDNVISGVTIDLLSTSDDPVSLTVSRDNAAMETAINDVITAYNALLDRISAQTSYDEETKRKGALLGDSTVSTLRSALARTAIGRAQGISGQFERLTDVGLEIGEGGKLSLDRDRLREALEEDFDAVVDVFAARELDDSDSDEISDGIFVDNSGDEETFTSLGVLFQIEELADNYLDSVDGVLTVRDRTIVSQIESQKNRIEDFDARLEIRRQILSQQFLAMEQALASLQSQQNALAALTQSLG